MGRGARYIPIPPTLRRAKSWVIDSDIMVPAGGSYTTPVVATNGFHYAQMVPASLSGSGTLAIGGLRQTLKGVLTWVHNSGYNPPPGMIEENGALGWGPPINDGIYGMWNNSSSTDSLIIGLVICNLSP